MNVYIVTERWTWDAEWNIDSIHSTRLGAEVRAEMLRAQMSEFARKNGKELEVENWPVRQPEDHEPADRACPAHDRQES